MLGEAARHGSVDLLRGGWPAGLARLPALALCAALALVTLGSGGARLAGWADAAGGECVAGWRVAGLTGLALRPPGSGGASWASVAAFTSLPLRSGDDLAGGVTHAGLAGGQLGGQDGVLVAHSGYRLGGIHASADRSALGAQFPVQEGHRQGEDGEGDGRQVVAVVGAPVLTTGDDHHIVRCHRPSPRCVS